MERALFRYVEQPCTWSSKSRGAKPCTGVRQFLSLFRPQACANAALIAVSNGSSGLEKISLFGRLPLSAGSLSDLRVLELSCNMAANNVLSRPSLHLGPSRQLVDEGRKFSLSLRLGPSRQLVDEK